MEDNNMKELLQKVEVLIEALPYIQRFNRKIIVVKYGGSAMVDEELKKHVIQDVTLLRETAREYRQLLEGLRDERFPADELHRATYLTDLLEAL